MKIDYVKEAFDYSTTKPDTAIPSRRPPSRKYSSQLVDEMARLTARQTHSEIGIRQVNDCYPTQRDLSDIYSGQSVTHTWC